MVSISQNETDTKDGNQVSALSCRRAADVNRHSSNTVTAALCIRNNSGCDRVYPDCTIKAWSGVLEVYTRALDVVWASCQQLACVGRCKYQEAAF